MKADKQQLVGDNKNNNNEVHLAALKSQLISALYAMQQPMNLADADTIWQQVIMTFTNP